MTYMSKSRAHLVERAAEALGLMRQVRLEELKETAQETLAKASGVVLPAE